jgi:hypothetical protein
VSVLSPPSEPSNSRQFIAIAPAAELLPRPLDKPGRKLQLLVLAPDRDHCAGVDLASGALVRAWTAEPVDAGIGPYDVVSGVLEDSLELLPDPSQPEALVVSGTLEKVGQIQGRKAERYLRPLLHPTGQPLLGIHAPTVPFWERTPDHPSVAVVEPETPPVIHRRGRWVSCSFRWRGLHVELPCLDWRVSRAMERSGRMRLGTRKGDRLVVAFTPPLDGHCHKVVAGLLPRP